MQRWFILNDNDNQLQKKDNSDNCDIIDEIVDNEICAEIQSLGGSSNSTSTKNNILGQTSTKLIEQNEIDRHWTFKLAVTVDILPNETLAVTGDCKSLGNWIPSHCVLMQRDEGTNNWNVSVNIPRDHEIAYRYFICSVEPISANIHIRSWETHLQPRILPELGSKSESIDLFGDVNGIQKIDRGWLTTETIIQFKLFNAPFVFKQRNKNRLLYVKITPMNLRIHPDSHATISNLDDSLSNDTRENGCDPPIYTFAEVAKLKANEFKMHKQPQFGTSCGPDDLVLFHISVIDFDSVAYLVDLYTYSSKADENDSPYHLGYHYILPNVLKKSEGRLELPITCASKHRPTGMMELEYLIIKPFSICKFDMRLSFIRYWNKKWTGLDVGHRGSGTSFKTKDTVTRENTIASLKKAAAHGADMVEFDVQLSKDLVPVIYHDFHVYVSLKSKSMNKTFDSNDLLELPMRELTLEQLKNLKVYHLIEGRTREPRYFDNEDMEEHQPFPTLADALDIIDSHCGFNIEIKSSQPLFDGTMEIERTVDRNLYVDCILEVVFRKAGTRQIVFSCFDPDICTMLRYKQNRYPVMFLTLGVTTRYPQYLDNRCNSIEKAVWNAQAIELLGIVAHTEDLLRDPTQVTLATDQGLIVFCWGDDSNSKEAIQQLKKMGLHAIIYDKMDLLTTKEVKESVFLVQARESEKEFFKLQCLELGRRRPDELVYIDENNERIIENDNILTVTSPTSCTTLLKQAN